MDLKCRIDGFDCGGVYQNMGTIRWVPAGPTAYRPVTSSPNASTLAPQGGYWVFTVTHGIPGSGSHTITYTGPAQSEDPRSSGYSRSGACTGAPGDVTVAQA